MLCGAANAATAPILVGVAGGAAIYVLYFVAVDILRVVVFFSSYLVRNVRARWDKYVCTQAQDRLKGIDIIIIFKLFSIPFFIIKNSFILDYLCWLFLAPSARSKINIISGQLILYEEIYIKLLNFFSNGQILCINVTVTACANPISTNTLPLLIANSVQ